MNRKYAVYACIAALVLAFVIGIGIGWKISRPSSAKPEKPAAAIRQADGSLVLERKATTPAAEVQAHHELPKGTTLERQITVTVQPGPPKLVEQNPAQQNQNPGGPTGDVSVAQDGSAELECPPVTVDLSLVRNTDGSRRIVASAENGTVVGGLDIPVSEPKIPRQYRWTAAAMVGYDARRATRVYGGTVGYQRGPFVMQGGIIGSTAFGAAGLRF